MWWPVLTELLADVWRGVGGEPAALERVAFAGDPQRYVLQAVHRIVDLRPADAWGDDKPVSKLVFIGRALERAALEAELRTCLSRA